MAGEQEQDPEVQGAEEDAPGRRRFLAALIAALGGAIAALPTVPAAFFYLRPPPPPPDVWRSVGRVGDFRLGETVQVDLLDPDPLPWAGFAAASAVLLRRTGAQSFVAFSTACTHVGCPVRWDAGARLFLCPCHGGAFYEDGTVAAGPPPRPLSMHPVRVRDGVVEVRTRTVRLPA